MHHLDMPELDDIRALAEERHDICVSIYLPTHAETQKTDIDRLELRGLVDEAVRQVEAHGVDKREVKSLRERLEALREDDGFWEHMATSLAVLATPENVRTYRLPSKLGKSAQVSDRFHLRPMIRAVSFPNNAYVLTFNEGANRLIEVVRDGPAQEVNIAGMPKDAQSVVGGHVRQEHGHEIMMQQYARRIDGVLQPLLRGKKRPLILACVAENAHHFKDVCSYPNIADEVIEGSPQEKSPQELALASREIIDAYNGRRVAELKEAFEERRGSETATADLSSVARAAAQGAIQTLIFDIDGALPGKMNMETGAYEEAAPGADSHDVIDDVIEMALQTGADLIGVRQADLPRDTSPVAALLRYAV